MAYATTTTTTTTTTTMVEATSLQTLNQLAANPPDSPAAPLPGVQPLTLYIARVPGSRDVFLTPIKPRDRVVTAEDVVSSLYYVHVSSDDDYEALRKPASRPSSVNTNAGSLPTLAEAAPQRVPPPLPRRRPTAPPTPPLPSNAPNLPYPLDEPVSMPRKAPPSLPPRPNQIHRKPVVTEDSNDSWHSAPAVRHHPLPTPPDEPPYEEQSLHAENLRLLRASSHLSEHDNPYSRNYVSHPETLKQAKLDEQQLEADLRPESGTLTLIRRDPGTTQQWNVASVYDPPIRKVSSSTLALPPTKRKTKKGGTPLYLDITNPGYMTFVTNSQASQSQSQTSLSSSDTGQSMPEVFHRRLYLPGSVHNLHAYPSQPAFHRKSSSLSAASGENSIPQMRHEGRHSIDLGSAALADQRSKGYTFISPWNGTCEFKTGSTGRTLKCRHRVGGRLEDVSELRFNLPSTSSPTKKPALGGRGERASYLARHRHFFSSGRDDDEGGDDAESNAPSIVVTDDGHIDLELGRERAGGGFGGKQAKLGKLIIEPKGLAMLDLLVAANVGLWWRAWERV